MASILKNGITLLGLAVIAGLGYYLFVINGSSELDFAGSGISDAQIQTNRFVAYLSEIKKLKISKDIFTDERFMSFVDYSEPVMEQSVGRENPFAPVE